MPMQTHNPNEAIELFRRMQLENVKPDEIAILAVLSACADSGALHLGEWIHNYIEKHKLSKIVPIYNSLIDMYAKSGNIRKALQLFENMKHKTIITWTTMITGLALHGLGKEALHVFSCMEKEGRVKPTEVTFIAVLSACSHVGLVELGRDYFTSMRSRYGIEPKIEHYGCMVDLLGRAGHLQEAKELVSRMPFEPNAAIWGSLLAASTRCGDAELAEEALRHLTVLEPGHSGNYSLLSNTYASLGRWSESREARKVMRDAGVEKVPGVSFIEVNSRVYEFIAGDKSSIYFVDIFDILHSLDWQIKIQIH
jgi:pentatricopeptide repeat protein